ncbi:UDP-glycosyltransferase UGT5-like isoform X1 [Periplaneta americana]|uniref:UDP-glycosyltransferase UGT5-like isoform X1 n=2 Tax=Periplaneta americana TaxID=6978 RepID=UPI0037E97F76
MHIFKDDMAARAVLLCTLGLAAVEGARILALLPVPSPSHHIWNRALVLALAAKGHHVTVFTPDREKKPVGNFREIIIEGIYEHIAETESYTEMSTMSYWENAIGWFAWGQGACEKVLASQGARRLRELAGRETFDLIIADLTLQECIWGFVQLFGSPPVVAVTAYVSPPWYNAMVGNPVPLAHVNSYVLPYSDRMTLWERTANFLLHHGTMMYRALYHMPVMDAMVARHFGSGMLPPSVLETNVSLVFVNTHFSLDYPCPLLPAMVPVGGIHIATPDPLPPAMKKFLDGAKQGAIFMSLGSNIRSDQMKTDKVRAFVEAFAELPHRVLWKWESDQLPGQPENLMVGKWMPQNDILAHPNIRLFISHAGMLSTQEAVYHGVPVVGVPFLADQFSNIYKLSLRGLGEKLEYETVTKERVLQTVRAVLGNYSYRDNMRNLSVLFKDQPETPLERAVFWTEYVLRHGGAPLRSASVDMPWHQYLLLDVVVVLLAGVGIVLLLAWLLIRTLCRALGSRTHEKQN